MPKSKILKIAGKIIEQIRKEKGVSLYKLAKISKLNYTHLKNIENGKIDCHLRIIIRICDALEINPIDFFEQIDVYATIQI